MSLLSKAQRAGIVEKLRTNKKYALSVTFMGADIRAPSYAYELADVLQEAGWEVSGLPAAVDYSPALSVMVGVDDPRSPNPCAQLLVDVLTAVGIKTNQNQIGAGVEHRAKPLLLDRRRIYGTVKVAAMAGAEPRQFGSIVPGVFTPVLAKHSKSFFAHRLHLGRRRPNAAQL